MRAVAAALLATSLSFGVPPASGEEAPAGATSPPIVPAGDPRNPYHVGLPQGWYADIDTTLGPILVRLLPEQAPQTVAHFAALAEGRLEWVDPLTGETQKKRYYDGLKVHVALAAQRFEAGDPTETGRGAPPIWLPPELEGPVTFNRAGRMGMTRSSFGKISGALFFITAAPNPALKGFHPCFGYVLQGREVVKAICGVKTDPRNKPLDPIVLNHVRIVKVGDPAPLPEPVHYKPVLHRLTPLPEPKTP